MADDGGLDGGSDTSDGEWFQTAYCREGKDDTIQILAIPGAPTATTSFVVEGAYDKATDIMGNPVILHDFFHGSWAANTGWTADGGDCYPVRLIYDDDHGTIRIDGYDCEAFGEMVFEVEEIHCPPEF